LSYPPFNYGLKSLKIESQIWTTTRIQRATLITREVSIMVVKLIEENNGWATNGEIGKKTKTNIKRMLREILAWEGLHCNGFHTYIWAKILFELFEVLYYNLNINHPQIKTEDYLRCSPLYKSKYMEMIFLIRLLVLNCLPQWLDSHQMMITFKKSLTLSLDMMSTITLAKKIRMLLSESTFIATFGYL